MSLAIFRNLRKMLGNIRLAFNKFSKVLEIFEMVRNLQKITKNVAMHVNFMHYMENWRYEISPLIMKNVSILEDKFHISGQPCNILHIIIIHLLNYMYWGLAFTGDRQKSLSTSFEYTGPGYS